MTEFTHEISSRIATTRANLRQARDDGEHYLVEVTLGELESLARLAADHGVVVEGVQESLAEYGLSTPATGVAAVLDLDRHDAVRNATQD